MTFDEVMPFVFGAVVLVVLASMARGYLKHGGFRGMMFGAGLRRTVGEVEGAGKSIVKTVVRVHVLDGAPERAIGLEFVSKSVASYQMVPVALSAAEARKLILHIQAGLNVH